MLEVRNIAFAYRKKPVLRDVSLVVSPGEVVSVVGANGAGKTTLLRILATVLVPDSGIVMLEGHDAFASPMRYRRNLGYLPENVALCDDMSARRYLEYRARLKGELPKRIRRRIGESAEICRMSDCLDMPIREMSAGQKKRVALADAFLLRPKLLLLDGFLEGLDHEMRQTAGAMLSDAAAFSSVIVTGHEISDFAKWTTRFLILKDGSVPAVIAAAGADKTSVAGRVEAALGGTA